MTLPINRPGAVSAPSIARSRWRAWGGGAARWLAGLAAGAVLLWSGAAQGQLVLTNSAGNIDVSKTAGNEGDAVIAYNPQNPAQMFIAANVKVQAGLFGAVSSSSGTLWTTVSLANLPAGAYPAVAWDGLGNLYLAYVDGSPNGSGIDLAVSTNGGLNFILMTNFARGLTNLGTGDFVLQPRIAVGGTNAGSVWVLYKDFSLAFSPLVAQGAAVMGTNSFGNFGPVEIVPGSTNNGGFGDIAVGPQGQVMVVYQNLIDSAGTATNYVSVDADGLGPNTFGPAVVAGVNALGGNTFLPATPDGQGINAASGLAWDTSPVSQNYGRVYMVCVGEGTDGNSNDTAILLNYSTDNGQTWSEQLQANDVSTNSRFLPRMAVDPTDGALALSWYDCRNDMGYVLTYTPTNYPFDVDTNGNPIVNNGITNYVYIGSNLTNAAASDVTTNPVGTNVTTNLFGTVTGIPNQSAMMYGTVSLDGGATFMKNVNITSSNFTTNGYYAPYAVSPTDFGDYTGMAFYGGTFFPVWADNSGSGGANPGGVNKTFDITVAPMILKGLADVSITTWLTNTTTNLFQIGSVINYFVTVSNAGPSAVTAAAVTDVFPPEVSVVLAFPTNGGVRQNYTLNGNTLNWSVGALAVKGTATMLVRTTAVGIGSATNYAAIAPGQGVADLRTNNNVSTLVTAIYGADLDLSISSAPAVIGFGGPPVTYTVTVSNQGPVTALGVYVSNLFSGNLVLSNVTLPPGGSYFTNAGVNDAVVTIGTMTNGQAVSFGLTAVAPLPPPFLGFGPATCSSIALGTIDPSNTNNSAVATNLMIVAPDLAIGGTGSPAFITVGDTVTYTLNVTNLGPVPAFEVAVTNFLPPDLQFASASVRKGAVTASPDAKTNGQTDIIATLNEPLQVGESSLVVITATALSVGREADVAVAGGAVPDANPANNIATVTTAVDAPDVSLTMTGSPSSVVVGQNVAYTLTVRNQGPVHATGVVLTNTLPASLAFAGVSLPVGMTYSVNQNTIVFNIGAMTNGQSVTVSIVAAALSAGSATNAAAVGDLLADSFGNNSAKVVTTVNAPLAEIYNLTVVPGVTGVFITWDTLSNATSQVDYGLTTASNVSYLNSTLTNSHIVMLTGLIPDTNYVFQARSSTAAVAAADATNGGVVTIRNASPAVLYTTNGAFSTVSSLTLGTMDAEYAGPAWTIGSVATGIFGSNNYEYVQGVSGVATASARFAPPIAVAGLYDVSIWYPIKPGAFSANTPVIVTGPTSLATLNVDQTVDGGGWQPLVTGMYFAPGGENDFTIYNNTGDTNDVAANGARWVYEPGQDSAAGTVPAWWANFYFGANAANPAIAGASADPDGGGYSNYANYVLGTDPTSASSQLQFQVTPGPSTNVTVTFAPYQGGRIYQLQSSPTLANPAWVTLTNIPAVNTNNGSGFFTVGQTPGATVFYRLSASLAPTQ
jgi:uncharacterized repeat protein (TIGR01451 family)